MGIPNRSVLKRPGLIFIVTAALCCSSFSSRYTPSYGIRTVVIDAGHGGKDPGCHGSFAKEKDVALGVSLQLGKLIEKYMPDVKVVYTRSTDVFVELDERAAIANRNKADLFICIHCNSACVYDKKTRKETCRDEAHGSETYVMGLHKTNANLNVAQRENASMFMEKDYKKKYEGFDPNSPEAYILLTMQQNAYLNQSIDFAASVQKDLKDVASRNDKGVQQAGFLVLWRTAMPSVLIETGFLTNRSEEKFLASEKGQQYMAAGIFRALRNYKDKVEGRDKKYEDDIAKMEPYKPGKDTLEDPPVKKDSSVVKHDEVVVPKEEKEKPKQEEQKEGKKEVKKEQTEIKEEPSRILFRVQVTTSDKKLPLDSKEFRGMEKPYEFSEKGMYKYAVGEYEQPNDAIKYQKELRKKYPDAFVIAFKDGKRIPYNDAVKFLKQ